MGAAARVVDAVAHRWAGGRWLATGGGGYGVYRVVPRAWSHTWLAGAHREPPDLLPEAWKTRWSDEAATYGDRVLPATFDDPPNAGIPSGASQRDAEERSMATVSLARELAVPRIIREAVARRWWSALGPPIDLDLAVDGLPPLVGPVEIVENVDRETLDRLRLAPRLVANVDPTLLREILETPALGLTMAVDGTTAVGLVTSALDEPQRSGAVRPARTVLAVGVAPQARRQGLATAMLRAHVRAFESAGTRWSATATVAERDPVEPLDRAVRSAIAVRVFEEAGFVSEAPDRPLRDADPTARRFVRD
jgi:ribosomal protein S18 acetylase RimI-like enzyme